MYLICNNCGRVHDSRNLKSTEEEYRCTTPGCNTNLFEIDEMMVPIITILWEKGYDTTSCCSGHYNGDAVNVPYIALDKSAEESILELPEGFEKTILKDSIIIEPIQKECPSMQEVLERNKKLLIWAETLKPLE